MMANDLFWTVAIHPLRGSVPGKDAAVEGLTENGIVGIFHDGSKQIG